MKWDDEVPSKPRSITDCPKAKEVKFARFQTGLSQYSAASLVFVSQQHWAEWESGKKKMHPAFAELFALKAGLKELKKIGQEYAEMEELLSKGVK